MENAGPTASVAVISFSDRLFLIEFFTIHNFFLASIQLPSGAQLPRNGPNKKEHVTREVLLPRHNRLLDNKQDFLLFTTRYVFSVLGVNFLLFTLRLAPLAQGKPFDSLRSLRTGFFLL